MITSGILIVASEYDKAFTDKYGNISIFDIDNIKQHDKLVRLRTDNAMIRANANLVKEYARIEKEMSKIKGLTDKEFELILSNRKVTDEKCKMLLINKEGLQKNIENVVDNEYEQVSMLLKWLGEDDKYDIQGVEYYWVEIDDNEVRWVVSWLEKMDITSIEKIY